MCIRGNFCGVVALCLVMMAPFTLFSREDHPPLEEEFEPYVHEEGENFLIDQLLAPQKNREKLLEDLHTRPSTSQRKEIPGEIKALFHEYVMEGSTVVDYGAANSTSALYLSQLVGKQGIVVIIESDREVLRALFWDLSLENVENVRLFYVGSEDRYLDEFALQSVSLMRVDARGREAAFLKGATKTIRKNRPTLLLRTLGGLPIELADKYVKQEFHKLMSDLSLMGYSAKPLEMHPSHYLAESN